MTSTITTPNTTRDSITKCAEAFRLRYAARHHAAFEQHGGKSVEYLQAGFVYEAASAAARIVTKVERIRNIFDEALQHFEKANEKDLPIDGLVAEFGWLRTSDLDAMLSDLTAAATWVQAAKHAINSKATA